MQQLNLKPTHAPVKAYYEALGQFGQLNFDHEMAVRSAFQNLLAKCGSQFHWTLIPEFPIPRPKAYPLKVDGALLDDFKLRRGLWEAKDEHDDLEKEVKKKIAAGYPTDNIIFQAPQRALLFQNGIRQGLNEDISSPNNLVALLHHFFEYRKPYHEEWESAVAEFSQRLPEIAAGAKQLIDNERKKNPAFVRSFADFYALCQQAINPNLSEDAVERMLIQHLLTERIFRRIFDNPDFRSRNVIAQEIEKVIGTLTSRHFNRDAFLHDLDRFYKAIEINADNATSYSEKQGFLNTIYERFFQGYSPKEADTHGIVYTPQPIVNFMVRSVEEILQKEFGRSLSDKGVHILDPFVGTGNFITRIMQDIKTTALPYKYENELHCNEVMLLPYYIASMNIEHAYFERTGEYSAFPGICLVDTFELAEAEQASLGFMTEENAQRVKKQKESPIFVIIGNPPYNMGQVNENDNNKNRKYKSLDRRVSETYAANSAAKLLSSLSDPYVKAFRWASDRIGETGIVAFVSNASYIDQLAFDGVRRCLAEDFSAVYVLDLGGNVRKNPKISGTTHNVFGIQVGVSIALLIRHPSHREGPANLYYACVDPGWRKEQKYGFLEQNADRSSIDWTEVKLDKSGFWLPVESKDEFADFVPLADKTERSKTGKPCALFGQFSHGVYTGRDSVVYNFNREILEDSVQEFIAAYNSEVDRWVRAGRPKDVDNFVDYQRLKWTRNTKRDLTNLQFCKFEAPRVRVSIYRPFVKSLLYLQDVLVDEPGQLNSLIPSDKSENRILWLKVGSEWPSFMLCTDVTPDYLPQGGSQCFPFYTYAEDGTHRRENITDWALEQFRSHYHDPSITKWDIFHYIYTVLHHPEYRERYAANLRRELPRIPFISSASAVKDVDVFRQLVKAGQRLAEIHVHYEAQPEYPLAKTEKAGEQLDYRVIRMKLSKDKTSLIYNQFLTLSGIPPETYEYRLGNRSALEWIVDQYQVSTDKRSGITNDPNRADDPEYILRLIGQVITVSLETVRIVRSFPELTISQSPPN